MCEHSYAIPRGDLWFCLHCKKLVPKPHEGVEEQNLVMPPRIYDITERLWRLVTPWQYIPWTLAKSAGWYISVINSQEYLVMPIFREGSPRYYSARRLGQGTGLKYMYPKGVKKLYWTSSDSLEGNPVIVCEGVADAVYCSLIGPSIGLLGSYYNGSLDSLLVDRHVALCLDGDAAGIFAAITAKQKFKTAKNVKIVILPKKFDPTDIPIQELRRFICQ